MVKIPGILSLSSVVLMLCQCLFLFSACVGDKNKTKIVNIPVEEVSEEQTDSIIIDSMPTAVEQFGQLSVLGNKIVDKNEKPVVLRGMSFCWSQWFGIFFTPEAVSWLKKDWKCTIVRAPLAVDFNGYLAHPEQEKAKVKIIIEAAIKEGLYVVIDWHDHEAEKHLKEAKAFFGEMAKLYGKYPNIIYEPYNEPLNISWNEVIKPYHEAIIDTIRTHDPDNLIVCGTRNWSMQVDEPAANPIKGKNIAYTLHFYAGTHKKWLRDRADKALAEGIALMVTEYGTADAPDLRFVDAAETQAWWDWLEENQISYINWAVYDKLEASSVLKPYASTKGHWPVSHLTESGKLVRNHLISKGEQKN